MAGADQIIIIEGHVWRDVTHETGASPIYNLQQVRAVGGDPEKLRGIYDTTGAAE